MTASVFKGLILYIKKFVFYVFIIYCMIHITICCIIHITTYYKYYRGITMAITKNDIHTVANSITSEGGSPTLAAIRKALGGGSFTTISEAMKEWKAQHQAQTTAAPLREAAPASINDRLALFGSEIWAIALEMANARLQSEREALELVRKELEETQTEAIDLADQLTMEIEQAQTTIQQQQDTSIKQTEEATQTNANLENEKSARQTAEHKCELTNAAMVEVKSHVKELKAELKTLRSELSSTEKKLVIAETKLSERNERKPNAKINQED